MWAGCRALFMLSFTFQTDVSMFVLSQTLVLVGAVALALLAKEPRTQVCVCRTLKPSQRSATALRPCKHPQWNRLQMRLSLKSRAERRGDRVVVSRWLQNRL